MPDKNFCEDDIFQLLSEEWFSSEQIIARLDLKEEYSRRWLAIKLKNLERSSEIKVERIGGIKFWKINRIIEINPDYEFQIKKYEELLDNDKNNYQALLELAKIYEEKGDYKKASNYFRECGDNEPDSKFGLIRTYYKSGDVAKAYKLLKKQKHVPLAHSNFASYILVDVGYNYLKKGNEEKAVEKFEKAIEHEYENDDAYFELGIIQFKRKDFKLAVRNFRAAIEFTGEEIPIDQDKKRWTCYIYAMQEIDSLNKALDLFELALTSANYYIEYWEFLVDIYIKFNVVERGLLFLDNFIQNEMDEKMDYDEYDKKAIINLQNIFLEIYLNKIVQDALSFYFSVSVDCSLQDLQVYVREKFVLEDKDLKFKVMELIKELNLPIIIKEGKFHSTQGKYSQTVQLKHGSELLIRTYISDKIDQLLPSPTDKNIKKFGKQIESFTEDFSDYEKYIVFKEVKSIMKAWDKLKPKVWKKILVEVAKNLPGLNIALSN